MADQTQNLVANYGNADTLGGLSGLTQMLQAQQMALQPQLASDVQSGNYTGAFKLATDNMSLLPSLMGPNSNSTLPTETLGATKTGYGAPVVNFAQGPNTGLSTMQKTWTPQQTQSYYDAFKGELPTIEQNMPASVAQAFDPNRDARSPLANSSMATYKSASSLPSQAPMLGGTPNVGKAFQNLISVPQQSQTDEMLIKMAIATMAGAALGPEVLQGFAGGGVGAVDAAATAGGGAELGALSLPTWAAAPSLLATAETGAVMGGINSLITGQDIVKGMLTGGVSGALGPALSGVGKDIASAAGGGQLGNMISKIATGAMTNATMAAVTGKNIGQGLESGAISGFLQTLSKDAVKAIVPDNTPGYLSAGAAGAIGGALTGAVRGQDPLQSALGGAVSSEMGYGLSQLGSNMGLSGFEQKALSTALNTLMAKGPSTPTAPTVAAQKPAPASTSTASVPPPVETATPTPVMHTTAPPAPTTNLGGTSSPPSSTIDPTLGRALSRENSFGGNK